MNEEFGERLRDLQLEVRAQGLLKNIREFDGEGSRKFREWLRDIDRAGAVVNANDERFKAFALQTLKGNAGDFVSRLMRLHPQLTWVQLRQQLVAQYSDTGDSHVAQIKLKGLKQKVGESIQNFSERIYSLADEAFVGENMNNPLIQAQLVEVLITGVTNSQVARKLINERPNTLDNALALAIRVQQNVRAYEMRRKEEPMDINLVQPSPDKYDQLACAIQNLELKFDEVMSVTAQNAGSRTQGHHWPRAEPTPRPHYSEGGQKWRSPVESNGGRRSGNKWWTADGKPVCFSCHAVGHTQRQCRSRRQAPQNTGYNQPRKPQSN